MPENNRDMDAPQAPSILESDVPDAGPAPDPTSPIGGEGGDEPGETDAERQTDRAAKREKKDDDGDEDGDEDRRPKRMVIGAATVQKAEPPQTDAGDAATERAPSATAANRANSRRKTAEPDDSAPVPRELRNGVTPLDHDPDETYVVVARVIRADGEERPVGEVLVIEEARKRAVLTRTRRVRELRPGEDSVYLSPDGRMWRSKDQADLYAQNAA